MPKSEPHTGSRPANKTAFQQIAASGMRWMYDIGIIPDHLRVTMFSRHDVNAKLKNSGEHVCEEPLGPGGLLFMRRLASEFTRLLREVLEVRARAIRELLRSLSPRVPFVKGNHDTVEQ
jgi:hypothetical protein